MISTFYSFKGGVGRSMAMANVAAVLARRGLRVLMIDFDLEAPGLEQFFQINQEGVRRSPGLLDLLLRYKEAMSLGGGEDTGFTRLDAYIRPVYERLPAGGRLDILPAGQRQEPEQLARYALNLRTFDWQDFYFNWKGDLFFEWLRRSLVAGGPAAEGGGGARYDLVLVDSRTGVTEMGGICGYQLADVIVMLCAANHQNVQGTDAMARDFRSAENLRLRAGRPLQIVIVPARIEQQDPALLEDFFRRFGDAFDPELPAALRAAGLGYRDLMIPYAPPFAFEERVVSDPDLAARRGRIGGAFERLARAIALLAPPGSPVARRGGAAGEAAPLEQVPGAGRGTAAAVLAAGGAEGAAAVATAVAPEAAVAPAAEAPTPAPAPLRYDPARRFAGYDVFVDTSSPDREVADALVQALRGRRMQVFFDREDLPTGADWRAVAEDALFHTRALLFCVGSKGITVYRQWMLDRARAAQERGQPLRVLVALLPGADPAALAGTDAERYPRLDLRDGLGAGALDAVVAAARERPGGAPRVDTEARAPFVGARPLDEPDADRAFERRAAVDALEQALGGAPLVALAGPTGSGKTSLVRAGLVPRLRGPQAAGGPWSVSFEDGPPSVDGTAAAARRRLVVLDEPGIVRDARDPLGRAAADWLDAVRRRLGQGASGLVIVPEHLLPRLGLAAAGVPVVRPGPMTPDELRAGIERSAERAGVACEPGLVERIVAEMSSDPGALRLLQTLLARLWARQRDGWLTNAAYDEVGGLRGLADGLAEQAWAALRPEAQDAARRLFLRLVAVSAAGDEARHRLSLDELLAPGATGAPAPLGEALRAFQALGLVTVGEQGGAAVVTAAHEGVLRGWSRLRGWIEADRAFLEWRQRLGAAQAAWRRGGAGLDRLLSGRALDEALRWCAERRPELVPAELDFVARSRRHRRGLRIAGALVAALMAAIVGGAAYSQRSAARSEARAAREAERSQAAERRTAAAAALQADADGLAKAAVQDRAVPDPALLERALGKYDEAVKLDPRNPTLRGKRASARSARGDLDGALADLDLALKWSSQPGGPPVDAAVCAGWYGARADLRERRGDLSGAAPDARKAAELQPTDPGRWVEVGRLAQLLADRGQDPERNRAIALDAYGAALRLDPDSGEALFNRGLLLERASDRAAAIRDFTAAARGEGGDPQIAAASRARLRQLGVAPAPSAQRAARRVQVQYAGTGSDLGRVEGLLAVLRRELQATVPPAERVAPVAVGRASSVRYFAGEDEPAARQVRDLVQAELARGGIPVRLELRFLDARRLRTTPRPGLVEVWLLPLEAPVQMKQ